MKDISKQVMKKIAGFEKRRIIRSIILFISVFVILTVLFVSTFRELSAQIYASSLGDLLTLLRQDWEIISEYWSDTLMTLLAEIPFGQVVGLLCIFIIILLLLRGMKKNSSITLKKFRSLDKIGKEE